MAELDPTQQLAEQIARTHFAVATSESPHVSSGRWPVYQHSQGLFLATIEAAYPDLDAAAVYDVWLDCMETVAHCVRMVRERQQRDQLSEPQARACLTAIANQFAAHLTSDCRPTLAQPGAHCPGWAIVWEDGPDGWAHRAFHGGHDDDVYHLALEAGFTSEQARETAHVEGVPCPQGVFSEPVLSFILGLYRA